MFGLIFANRYTGSVMYAINNVTLVRYVTPSEVGFVDNHGHIRSTSFTQVENLEIARMTPDMTPERQKQIYKATPENPVHLTPEEEKEMREENMNNLQHGVGAGRFIITPREGSSAAKVLGLQGKGLSNAAIAHELGISESTVRRVLSRVH